MRFHWPRSAAVVATLLAAAVSEKWAWPDHKQQKLDGKVLFEDNTGSRIAVGQKETGQADEYRAAAPVQIRSPGAPHAPLAAYGRRVSYTERRPSSDEWTNGVRDSDSLGHCRCVDRAAECVHPEAIVEEEAACQSKHHYLCCSSKGRRNLQRVPGDSRALSSPNHYKNSLNFPESEQQQVLVGPGGPTAIVGPADNTQAPQRHHLIGSVLVGPGGPTGIVGPNDAIRNFNNGVLGGASRQTGQFGLTNRPILVGPGGPTGIIGPNFGRRHPNNGVLVGPGGPTGIIGPPNRPVLIGPGGPTGHIGPSFGIGGLGGKFSPASVIKAGNGNGVLVGPGGPTGLIGPGNRPYNRGILAGPGGPTGIVGPA